MYIYISVYMYVSIYLYVYVYRQMDRYRDRMNARCDTLAPRFPNIFIYI